MGEKIPASDTGGVKPMSITGRMVRERERCIGMTDDERKWRAQWLKDQELTAREPVFVKEYQDALRNPIRRFYQFPMDIVRDRLVPVLGPNGAQLTRLLFTRSVMGIGLAYATWYYFKYNANDWTRKGGWRVIHSRARCYPGDEGYPKPSDRTKGADYASRGFQNAPI